MDDFGWADAGWHRPKGYSEVQTPNMDELVATGVELDQHYTVSAIVCCWLGSRRRGNPS